MYRFASGPIAVYLCLTSLKECFEHEVASGYRGLPTDGLVSCCTAFVKRGAGPTGKRSVARSKSTKPIFGGKEKNKHARKKLNAGRGPVGKTAVVGAKDRATNRVSAAVVTSTDGDTLKNFVADRAEPGAKVYTDDHGGYAGLPNHETVRHSVAEYVKRTGSHERDRVLLVDAQAGAQRHVSQAFSEAFAAVRRRVRR